MEQLGFFDHITISTSKPVESTVQDTDRATIVDTFSTIHADSREITSLMNVFRSVEWPLVITLNRI
jgi:hypothetical protein